MQGQEGRQPAPRPHSKARELDPVTLKFPFPRGGRVEKNISFLCISNDLL